MMLQKLLLVLVVCVAWSAPGSAASSAIRDENAPAHMQSAAATVAFWPRDATATTSHARDAGKADKFRSSIANGRVRVETSGRGFFGTFSTALHAMSQLVWVPPVQSNSSTFDFLFAPLPQLFAVHSVGFHIQVSLTTETSLRTFSNVTIQETVEANVEQILSELFPTEGSLPVFQKGFLAKSLCRSHSWTSAEPMREAFKSDSTASLCYSSAYSYPALTTATQESRLPVFPATKNPSVTTKSSIIELYFQRRMVDFEAEKRLTHVTISHENGDSNPLVVDILEAWTVDSATSLSWQPGESEPQATRLVVVSLVQHWGRQTSIDYTVFQDDSVTTGGSQVLLASQGKLFPTLANVSIIGEGFHRRLAIDVDVKNADECNEATSKLLVRVPLSHEVYADLDELRRMERFGELRLLAFIKHIEIERPSPVSPQHMIALEFPMSFKPSTTRGIIIHVDFPIHFRYQASSESELYRAASVVAPELFLYCPGPVASENEADLPASASGNIHNEIYFQMWPASRDHRSAGPWQRLSLQCPVEVADVATPVGFLPNGPLVSLATLSVASAGALLLIFVAVTGAKNRQQVWTNADAASQWKPKAS